MIRSLAVVTHGYPCAAKPSWLVFVRQIAHAFARQGVETSVVCPLAIHRAIRGRDQYQSVEDAGGGASVTVYRPRYLSISSRGFGRLNTFRLSCMTHHLAAQRVFKRRLRKVDALYGHFLYPSGACAARLGRRFAIPAFPAVGEISLDTAACYGRERVQRDFSGAAGIIANSTHLATLLQQELGFDPGRVSVFPNAVNRSLFFPRDRVQARLSFGLPRDLFLVACVGAYETRKGQTRVAAAIDGLEGLGGVFVGAGDEPPRGRNVVFSRPLPHDQVPELLSACDAFVLPTMDEGCCNAIIEAMACGLPVVSSTGAFNDEILNPDVSIRTDALDVAAIRDAIVRLRDDRQLRTRMAREALRWSENFDADHRARRILEFMSQRIGSEPMKPFPRQRT
jgi:teichuronic acid biosynthesis glycosyltransferase TuaC